MQRVLIIYLIASILGACNSVEPDKSQISPLSAIAIKNIELEGNNITVNIIVSTPTPCWYYYKTEVIQDESSYTAKIFGKYDGEPCVQVLSSFMQEEKISFTKTGEKNLSFWINDSSYLDTLVNVN